MANKPHLKSLKANEELDKLEKASQEFTETVKTLSQESFNNKERPSDLMEAHMSKREKMNATGIVLKPVKTITPRQKFNEKFRELWEWDKQLVLFIAEHREMEGNIIEIWTYPFGGVNAEFWHVPSGRPVWGPRYLERQCNKSYTRLKMENKPVEHTSMGTFTGQMVIDTKVHRITSQLVRDDNPQRKIA